MGVIKRVFIGGDRAWDDVAFVESLMRQVRADLGNDRSVLFVSGGARGVDSMVRLICMAQVWPFCEFPAPWDGGGRSAGPIRNNWAIKFGKLDLVFGIHNDLSMSKGTRHMLTTAKKKGIKAYLANRTVGYYGEVEVQD